MNLGRIGRNLPALSCCDRETSISDCVAAHKSTQSPRNYGGNQPYTYAVTQSPFFTVANSQTPPAIPALMTAAERHREAGTTKTAKARHLPERPTRTVLDHDSHRGPQQANPPRAIISITTSSQNGARNGKPSGRIQLADPGTEDPLL